MYLFNLFSKTPQLNHLNSSHIYVPLYILSHVRIIISHLSGTSDEPFSAELICLIKYQGKIIIHENITGNHRMYGWVILCADMLNHPG